MNFILQQSLLVELVDKMLEQNYLKLTETELKKLGYDVEEVIMTLQQNLLQGDLTLPEGLKRESFVDD